MFVGSLPMSLVIEPVTFVYVTVCVQQHPMAVCLVIVPETIVAATIRPNLLALAVLFSVESLACVD